MHNISDNLARSRPIQGVRLLMSLENNANIWLNVCISRSSEIFTNVPAFHGCIYFIARFPISNCSACLTKSIPVEFLFKYAVFGGRNLARLYHHVNLRNLIKIFRT